MTDHTRFRAALTTVAFVTFLLAGCSVPAGTAGGPLPDEPIPVEPDGGTGTTDPATLDYPYLLDVGSAIPAWRLASEAFSSELDAWNAGCTPADALSGTACHSGLRDLRATVNGIHSQWWSLDDANWESREYSGLIALEPTRDATFAAKSSGEDWESACTSGAEDVACLAAATAYHSDLSALDDAYSAWRG